MIYNTYFEALSEMADSKIAQKQYGDQVFKFARIYYNRDGDMVAPEVEADI
jgi:hypothetical protein